MKKESLVAGLFAVALAFATVLCFSPSAQSFWGFTFFGIKYSIALWVVPSSCFFIAVAISSFLVRKTYWPKKWVTAGALGGFASFVAYAFIHVLIAALAGMPFGLAMSLLLPIFTFGGLFIMPVAILLGILASLSAKILCASTHQPHEKQPVEQSP